MLWDSVNIGLTNRCNARCSFCPVSETDIQRMDMSMDMIESIIQQTKGKLRSHISLALFGESTLHPQFNEIVRYIRSQTNIHLILYTNGIDIDRALDGINMLDRVTVSVDATDRDEYLKIKGIDAYDRVMENIKRIKSFTVAQFAALPYKQGLSKPIGADRIKHGRYITWGGEIMWDSPTQRKVRKPALCGYLNKNLFIGSNGDVVICCIDYNHKYVAGNIQEQSLEEIWNGEKMNEFRKNHIGFDICINCETEV